MAVVYTLTQVGRTNVVGARKQKVFNLTSDTGTYVTGGDSLAASRFGLSQIDFVSPCGASTGGTSGATINWIGCTYPNTTVPSASVTVQQYECAATGLPGLEKTSGEAMVANYNCRITVQGS